MQPNNHNEMTYYIGKRIKMILHNNIHLIAISTYINIQKTQVKVQIVFKQCNTEYKYNNTFNIDRKKYINNVSEKLINDIICHFEKKYNF